MSRASSVIVARVGYPDRVAVGGLQVAGELYEFVEDEALPGTGLAPADFWTGVAQIVDELAPVNAHLLAERDRLQAALDDWYQVHGTGWEQTEYEEFLERIGYLLPEPTATVVTTTNVDNEVTGLAGPQLVVPVTNARYALNAANARWGSLYDALYGTDALFGAPPAGGYDRHRGDLVVAAVRTLLDEFFPLSDGSHGDAIGYAVRDNRLEIVLPTGATELADGAALAGWAGQPAEPEAIVLRRHGLHLEICIDRSSPVGRTDPAGVSDVQIEAAPSAIIDFEDSVAVVDAADKVAAYRNWLGLNRGDLQVTFQKRGHSVARRLNDDRRYVGVDGIELVLPGRALLFVRNVGHLMTTDSVLDGDGAEIGEGILDAIMTALCAVPGLAKSNSRRNGRAGSVYIVKPKMHGPDEVALTVKLFSRVEQLLGLPPLTLKLGLMDEERRTSVNLAASIAEATDRLIFINTGFLDRSGDEIHTSFEAGPVVRKADLQTQPWIRAYEDRNVDVGLAVGLPDHGQIGKGMWAMPDLMGEMLQKKIAHPLAGATTAWVPSPTAAVLHALHYLRVDVRDRQRQISQRPWTDRGELLKVPLGDPDSWSPAERQDELDNNVQSLLGYVVRWVDQGIGCSKVPDVHDVALMEDRATLRISSQLLANWLRHGVISEQQVESALARMAGVVDEQNAVDPLYQPMTKDPAASVAFQAARELIFEGARQPNGYTEPILHRRRREAKERQL